MPKYKIVCKGCNTVHGFAEKPVIDGLSAKCSTCGLERIAVEPAGEEIYSELNFDIFITRKDLGTNVHNGFLLSVEDLKGKSEDEIRNLFIEQSAKTLAGILEKPENLEMLLK